MATPEPAYTVILHEGNFEVRDYAAEVVAQVTASGDQDAAGNAGFRLLAGYIFGGNASRQHIAMTAPVIQTQRQSDWTVRFIMPPQSALKTLPVPNDSRVTLVALPPTRFAVVRFSGLAFEHDVSARTDELRQFIAAHHLQPAGPPWLARYNPPWTPWFMRRNEVLVPLEAATPPE
jgi:hypothetical protein